MRTRVTALIAYGAATALVVSGFAATGAVADEPGTVVAITAGSGHSLGLDSAGAIYAWGANSAGQLGDGSTAPVRLPKAISNRGAIPAGVEIEQVVATGNRSFALGADGEVYSWGSNTDGALGDGTTTPRTAPVQAVQGAVPAGVKLVEIAASAASTYALGDDGKAYAWGSNASGVLGDGTTTSRPSPVAVNQGAIPAGVKLVEIAAGEAGSHVVALGDDGRAYAWGPGGNGRLGNGATTASTTPVLVSAGEIPADVKLVDVAVGTGHTVALADDGKAYAWGDALYGALGNGIASGTRSTPIAVHAAAIPVGVKLVQHTVLVRSTVALGDDGEVYSWGHNMYGQLGDGTTSNRSTPVAVADGAIPAGVELERIAGKSNSVVALGNDGRAYGWGTNASSQLGDGTTASRQRPVLVGFNPADAAPTTVTLSTTGSLIEGESFTAIAEVSPAVATGTVRLRLGADGNFDRSVPVVNGRAEATWTAPAYGNRELVAEFTTAEPVVFASSNATLPISFLESPTPKIRASHLNAITGTLGAAVNPHVTLTLSDGDTSVENLTITATSSAAGVIPASNIAITGAGATRTVTLTPGTAVGLSTLTFTVRDPEGRTSTDQIVYHLSAGPESPTARYYSGASDASAAIDVGDGHVLVADDENQVIRLYRLGENSDPVRTFDFTNAIGVAEVDLEGAARRGDTIYWVGSYGNSSSSGQARPERRTTFTTKITGSGADTVLTFDSLYPQNEALFADLVAWDASNGHGLGANTLKFVLATRPGVFPFAPDGFGVEGFEFAPGTTGAGYLAFRGPSITHNGTQHGLIVPVNNFEDVVTEKAAPSIGAPIFLDLGGRSIRDIRKNANDEYLILAGPISTQTWAVYTWDGKATSAPVLNRELPTLPTNIGGGWETIASMPDRLTTGAAITLITDSGDAVIYGQNTALKDYDGQARKAYSDTFALAEVPVIEQLGLASTVSTKSVAGKAYLTVTVKNVDVVAADVKVETPFGSKEFSDVAPGATVTVSFNSRVAVLPAGVATVTGVGSDGTEFEGDVPFGVAP